MNQERDAEHDELPERRPRRRARMMLIVLLSLVVIWVAGDFIYSRVIKARMQSWEASITRDDDGVREGCHDFTIGDGRVALLMVHGINDSPACYSLMAPALAERGFTCRSMRLPGFAEPIERYAAATGEQWRQAVREEIESLRKKHDRVVVIAHSLGAAVVLAETLGSQLADKLVLIAPAVEVSDARSPILSAQTWHKVGNRLLLFTRVTESPFGLDAKKTTDEAYPWRTPYSPRDIFEQTFLLLDNNRGRAAELTTPLMVLISRDDQVIDWRAAEQFYNDVASSEKEIHYIEETGHSMTVDHVWPELVDHIARFAADDSEATPVAPGDEKQP